MRNVVSFPEPFPDEDFRSIIYRYHLRSGNTSIKKTSEELFGTVSMTYGHIPRRLRYLVPKLPIKHKFSEDYFIENHTYTLFFKCFISEEEYSEYLDNIRVGSKTNSNRPAEITGVRHIKILSKNIRYCPDCLRHDFQHYGECYVHLMHQIEFVDCCMLHRTTKLIDTCHVCNETFSVEKKTLCSVPRCSNNHDLTIKASDAVENINIKCSLYDNFLQVQKYSNYLSSIYILDKLYIALGNKGYIHFRGLIYKKKLINELCDFYSDKIMKKMGMSRENLSSRENIKNFLTKSHIHKYPIFYFLLIVFIFGGIERFIQYNCTYAIFLPFRPGPWICLNRICEGYNNPVIEKIIVSDKSNQLVGTFTCELCGFSYSKTHRDQRKRSIFSIKNVKVVSYGWLWTSTVKKLFLDGKSVLYISKKVKSDRNTVRKYLEKQLYGLEVGGSVGKANHPAFIEFVKGHLEQGATYQESEDEFIGKRNKYRERILNLTKTSPDISRDELHKKDHISMRWLIRNDITWIDTIVPCKKNVKYDQNTLRNIDQELSEKIWMSATALYHSSPSLRISKNLILNELETKDRKLIHRFESELKKTREALSECIESLDHYLLRNLPTMVSKEKSRGIRNVTYHTLSRVSARYRKCSMETKIAIEEELKSERFMD